MFLLKLGSLQSYMRGKAFELVSKGNWGFNVDDLVDNFISYLRTHLPNERDGFSLVVRDGIPREGMEAYIMNFTYDFGEREFLRRCVPKNYTLTIGETVHTDNPVPLSVGAHRRYPHDGEKRVYVIVRNSPRYGTRTLLSMVSHAIWELRNRISNNRIDVGSIPSPTVFQVRRGDFDILQRKYDNASLSVMIRDREKNRKAVVAMYVTVIEATEILSDLSLFNEFDG